MLYTVKYRPRDFIFKVIQRDIATGAIVHSGETHNVVLDVACEGFVKLMNGEGGFTGLINYLAVGTGSNTPLETDTMLQAEIARTTIVPSSNVRTGKELELEFFFGATEANGNIKELGLVIDGTATLETGVFFDRALYDITKTSSTSLSITAVTTAT